MRPATYSIVADGLDHPECVAVGPDGALYAGGEAGQIYRIDVHSGEIATIAVLDGFILGIALDGDGNVYACDTTHGCVWVVDPEGHSAQLTTGTPSRPMRIPNYPAFDAQGNLYVSDSGAWDEVSGCIFRVRPDGATEVWSESAPHFTNGLAIAPDGSSLYVAESTLPGVTRVPIHPDGAAGDAEVMIVMPATVPDGLAFDESGALYIACYRPDAIYRWRPNEAYELIASDDRGTDFAAPTNVAFGGPGRSDLYVASLARWHISRIRHLTPGLALHYPNPIKLGAPSAT